MTNIISLYGKRDGKYRAGSKKFHFPNLKQELNKQEHEIPEH